MSGATSENANMKPSEKSHERAKRLAIRRLIATLMKGDGRQAQPPRMM
jgi:hypothetical protein